MAIAASVNICITYTATTIKGLTTSTTNALGAKTTSTAADASIITVNNDMHKMLMYTTNGVLGSLSLMGASFQLMMQFAMIKQVQRYKRIFGDKELEAEINAASQ